MRSTKTATFAALALLLISTAGCSIFESKAKKVPLEGERISVIAMEQQLQPDVAEEGETRTVTLPSPWKNEYWPQVGGYPNHVMQNPALGENLSKQWDTNIGSGSRRALPLTSQPVVFDDKVFTLDTNTRVSAFDVKNGKRLWETNARPKSERDPVIAGGLAFAGGTLFVTSGYNQVLAIDPANGNIKWTGKLPSAARAAPTVLDGRVFVPTLDNRIITFAADSGQQLWEYQGISGVSRLVKAASPAANSEIVVPVFSTGEIYALRVSNGSVAWVDNLAPATQVGGIKSITDISGQPVLDSGLVYAGSYGGILAAIDERSGTRVWQREFGISEMPWIAGDVLFALTVNKDLVALNKLTGVIYWVTTLKTPEKSKGTVTFHGPVIAGNRAIVASSDGTVLEFDAISGKLQKQWSVGKSIRLAPIVAAGTLYILADDGTLHAYR